MRRRYVYDPELKKMVEVPISYQQPQRHAIVGEIEPFRSPHDGTPIFSRKQLREHMKANRLVHADDYKDTWAKSSRERVQRMQGATQRDKRDRIEALKHAIDRHSR